MQLQDILAAFAVVVNGLPQALLALTYGFAAFPTALGFLTGAAGMLFFGQVAPISFQAEAIVLAGQMGKDRAERLNIVFFCGIAMAAMGAAGVLQTIIGFIGQPILDGMMAGVGMTLAKVSFDMVKSDPFAGGISLLVALAAYFITEDLIYTILLSAILSSVVWAMKNKGEISKQPQFDQSHERFERLKLQLTPSIIRKVLALSTLQIGGNIAYAGITGGLANMQVNVDQITIYSGLADCASSFFGGGPVEAIISGTALAPDPVASGVLMMLAIAAILLSKTLPKIARYVPNQCIAGFLFVLGAMVVFPGNAAASLSQARLAGGVTIVVTAVSDPFIGMLAGVLMRFAAGLAGA